MISAWLANKAFGIVCFILACMALVTIPVVVVQTVRLDGVTVLGWHIVDGAIQARDAAFKARDNALSDLGTSRANQGRLQAGLDQCNASIDNLAKTGTAITAAANKLVSQAAKSGDALKGNIVAVQAIQATAEKCPAADAIISRGFQ